ncbi:hypothetical protein FKM82_030307 [Ascaphus truei]
MLTVKPSGCLIAAGDSPRGRPPNQVHEGGCSIQQGVLLPRWIQGRCSLQSTGKQSHSTTHASRHQAAAQITRSQSVKHPPPPAEMAAGSGLHVLI